MEKQSSNPQDFCNTSQTPANIKVTEEPRGEETWCFTTAQFKTLGELRSLYEQRKGIRVNRLEFKDGRFLYEVELDTLSEDSGLSQLTEITWSVVMPGALIDHNADQVDGNTLTWRPAPKSSIILLRAESELPQSGFDFPACGGAFVISIGGVFLHITHGRARRTKDTSE